MAQQPDAVASFPVVTISELNQDGRGVARLDGKVVFIDGVLPDEQVRVRIVKRKRRFDLAVVEEIVTPSPHRVTPPCEYFRYCGGCGLQHLSSQHQIHYKADILRHKLQEFGHIQPQEWLPPLHGADHGYRRRARLGARLVPAKGGVLVGFRERHSSYLAVMDHCRNLDPRVGGLLPQLKALVGGLSCARRIPQIEVSAGDDSVALIFRHLEALTARDHELLRAFGRRHDMIIYLQPGGPDDLQRVWPDHDVELRYRLPEFDVEFAFSPTGFIQINADMNRRMVHQALTLLDPAPHEQVVDLFCGLGNFTLPLARRAARVIGVEASAQLVQRARDNARRNGIDNVEFREADLYREQDGTAPWGEFHFDKLLLDPPRDGAMQVLKQLPQQGPRRIVYVSCNAVTLARDAEYLVNARGYRLCRAGVMDMFPHTHHVEAMAVFEIQ